MIASGEIREDSKLPAEQEIAQKFSVSRSVVREALARLRDDELIYSRQGSGSFVRRKPDQSLLRMASVSSIADIQRCFEFRVALEGEAAAVAASRCTDAAFAEVEKALRSLDKAIEHHRLGVEEDFQYHLAVAAATGNKFFTSAMMSLQAQIIFGMNLARTLSLARPSRRLRQVQEEHCEIVDAIHRKDATRARATMRAHLENARRRVFEGAEEGNRVSASGS